MSEPAQTPLRPIFGFSRLGYALLAIAIVLAGIFAWVRVHDIDTMTWYMEPIAWTFGGEAVLRFTSMVQVPYMFAVPGALVGFEGLLPNVGFTTTHVAILLIAWQVSARRWRPWLEWSLLAWALLWPVAAWSTRIALSRAIPGEWTLGHAISSGVFTAIELLVLCMVVRWITPSRAVRVCAYLFAFAGLVVSAVWDYSSHAGWRETWVPIFTLVELLVYWLHAFALGALTLAIIDRWRTWRLNKTLSSQRKRSRASATERPSTPSANERAINPA